MTNVVLAGFMGTGKTSVGRALARSLGLGFLDLDEVIEAGAGMTIKDIFAAHGEARFRVLEKDAVKRLVSGELGEGLVVATGGGAVVDAGNRAALKSWGTLVCLVASVEEILKRVGGKDDRPLLNRDDREEAIETLLEKRIEAYSEADFALDTTALSVQEAANAVKDYLARTGKAGK